MENTINTWAEAIAALPDTDFFSIMRLYLGKIQTPYNKQRLVSQLASFLKTPKITESVLTLLNNRDLEFLSAVYVLDGVEKESLREFFNDTYQTSEFYTIISNLRERLLIYSVNKDGKDHILINPIILESIKDNLGIARLLPIPEPLNNNNCDSFVLTPNFLTAFFACIRHNSFTLKNDGSLKKNGITKLEEIFPGKTRCAELLISAFLNLSIFHEAKTVEIDDEKLLKFVKLSQRQQYALLSAAASSHLSREALRKHAQLLLDCVASIPETGFTQKAILRLAFILGSKTGSAGSQLAAKGRFAQLLEAARQKPEDAIQNKNVLERMLEAAEEFGLIQKSGLTKDGEEFYKAGILLEDAPAGIKPLNVESAYSVSLMPGLPLKLIVPLTHFLEIKSFGIVSQFELTKTSVTNAFDAGFDVERILETLRNFCNYELPQNMRINLQEWYNTYSAAVLYHGYVLKVAPENIAFAENNPKIQKYVQEKLTDGIYLLNLPADVNVSAFFEECGLPARNVKTAVTKQEVLDFPLLRDGKKLSVASEYADEKENLSVRREELLLSLEKALIKVELDKNQRENLSSRIKNRLILTAEQLSSEAIRTEILEAEGMDFSGKLHLIDAAMKEDDLLEIQMPQANGAGYATIVGTARNLERTEGYAILTLAVKDEEEHLNINVSRITHLRRLHF